MPQAELFEDTQTGTQTFALGPGWENVTSVNLASPDNGQGSAVLNVATSNGNNQTVAVPHNQLETRVAGSQIYRKVLASVAELGVNASGEDAPVGEGERNAISQQPDSSLPPVSLPPGSRPVSRPVIDSRPIEVSNNSVPLAEGESLSVNSRSLSSDVRQLAQSIRHNADSTLTAWPSEAREEIIAEHAIAASEDHYAESLDDVLADDTSDLLSDLLP